MSAGTSQTFLRTPRLVPVVIAAAILAPAAHSQPTRTTHVVDGIHLITGAGGNVTVSTGHNGILVVDSGAAGSSDAVLAAIREISDGTIRYVVNTSALPEHIGGNVTIRAAGDTFTGGNATVVGGVDEGAAVLAHENVLLRLSALRGVPVAALPTETFFVPKIDLYFNNEPVEFMYEPNAVDDTNVIVHFRRSDVIVAGDVFRTDRFPDIDLENGGSINGIIDALNHLVDLAVADTLSEGGTLIIPGHGRICDEGDLVRYRDMLTVIRDRVRAWIERGESLAQIKARRPLLDYESRYGRADGDWTADTFIEAVYTSLAASGNQLSSQAQAGL
jgi:glyoxylase-like metal-dependent hydrolase (beta-lactamase superfamily II)